MLENIIKSIFKNLYSKIEKSTEEIKNMIKPVDSKTESIKNQLTSEIAEREKQIAALERRVYFVETELKQTLEDLKNTTEVSNKIDAIIKDYEQKSETDWDKVINDITTNQTTQN